MSAPPSVTATSAVIPSNRRLSGKAALDAWAKEHSGGLVPESSIVPEPDLRLVLQDAIVLAARWEQPFPAALTEPDQFTLLSRAEVLHDTALVQTRREMRGASPTSGSAAPGTPSEVTPARQSCLHVHLRRAQGPCGEGRRAPVAVRVSAVCDGRHRTGDAPRRHLRRRLHRHLVLARLLRRARCGSSNADRRSERDQTHRRDPPLRPGTGPCGRCREFITQLSPRTSTPRRW